MQNQQLTCVGEEEAASTAPPSGRGWATASIPSMHTTFYGQGFGPVTGTACSGYITSVNAEKAMALIEYRASAATAGTTALRSSSSAAARSLAEQGTAVAVREVVADEREDETGVASAQLAPSSVPLAQRVHRLVLHAATPSNGTDGYPRPARAPTQGRRRTPRPRSRWRWLPLLVADMIELSTREGNDQGCAMR